MVINVTQHPVCVLTDWPLRTGWEKDFLTRKLMSEGIHPGQTVWLSVLESRPYGGIIYNAPEEVREAGVSKLMEVISTQCPNVILACGDFCLTLTTGLTGIDKWQASVLAGKGNLPKVIPCYPPERVAKDMSLQVWVSLCAQKVRAEMHSTVLSRPEYKFHLSPPINETLEFLRERVCKADEVTVDIETGRGQINTVGFGISPTEAIAINVLPEKFGPTNYYELWKLIAQVLESDQKKILQNFIYEHLYFSRYGILMRNVHHDTMVAQKFLWPELTMGLDSVGRMYTDMPYWKDDGKDWTNIRDWRAHYEYNCKDNVGTFQGFLGQRKDLRDRGLLELHDNYLRRLYPAIAEMCSRGLPLCETNLMELREIVGREYTSALAELKDCPGAEKLNPRSPIQVKKYLTEKGYSIPKKYDSGTKQWKESTDEKSLKKLRMKHKDDASLSLLLKLAKLGKAQSSYLSFTYDSDKRMRFSLNAHGTETGRFAGNMDPWDQGVNPQTVPGGNKGINIKRIFKAPEGKLLFQCDLRQAESRFVAYDSADLNLIRTLEDPNQDIHKNVAMEILSTLGKPQSEYSKFWRQLGKKSGHGANYSMKEATFIDSCIQEMDIVLSKTEATGILESYHKLFPGIRRWHANLRNELAQKRMLTNPLGRQRQFFGRLDDDTFREAYAYRPQSTIPDVTNHLMLHLCALRERGLIDFGLLLQCHDSLLLEIEPKYLADLYEICSDTSQWHPEIILAGGRLVIPTECEVGEVWGEVKKYEPGNREGKTL